MSFIVRLCLFFFAVSISNISVAQQNVFVVDIEAGALRSNYAKEFLKKATDSESYKNGIAAFNKLTAEFKGLQGDAKTNGLTWSDDEKKTYKVKLERKLQEVNQLGRQLESAKNSLQGRVIQELTPDMEKIVQAIIDEKKIDILLNARSVSFQKPEFNITGELTKKLNELKAAKK